jgi:hypothetical protein
MSAVAEKNFGVRWEKFPADDPVRGETERLALQKYGTDAYNQKR